MWYNTVCYVGFVVFFFLYGLSHDVAQSKLSASCFALLVRGLGTGREGRWGGRAIVARHVVYRFQTTTTSSVVFYRVIVFFCVCVWEVV